MAQGWPFLVARGRRLGYRTILAPPFLTERRLQGVLAESANGDQPGLREVHVERAEVGPLTLVYRIERVTAEDIGGNGFAADQHGRPLEIVYGLVCRGRLRGCADAADLTAARAEALGSYRRFLADESRFAVDSSGPLALHAVPEQAKAPHEPPKRERRRGIAVPIAVALCGLLALVALPAGSGDEEVRVVETSATPPSGELDCTRPLVLELGATIETERSTQVRYRWRSGSWETEPRTVPVDGHAQLPREYPGASALPGPFELVIERPEATPAEVGDGLRCAR